MKRHILFLGFLLMMFGAQLSAQTLKNIHRHNLPVLQIPIDLIDKVETVDVAGQKYLHIIQFNGFVNEVLVSQIDSITHSEGQTLDPAQLGNLRTASVMGIVRGPTGAPEMNAIVRSPYGGEETRTDPNGVFFLNGIVVYDKLGYITITKPGFHQASRSFLPLETGSNRVNIQLLPMTQSGSFSATTGGTVTSGLLQLNFPANAFQLNGQPYTGTVRVYAAALDPSSTEMFDQMPGELLGGMNDSLRMLRSFGMASIELRDANMNELQLAEGASATLTFNIPSALLADAPETIDWWSFDETLGYWKHEGEAQKQGNSYLGQASHFSWWNVTMLFNSNYFQGVVNAADGNPVSGALINIISSTSGTNSTHTNAEGRFNVRVPKDQTLTLNVLLNCNTTNVWDLAHSESIISGLDPIFGTYTASLNNYYPITGTVASCSGQPVESGYVRLGSQVFLSANGAFTIQTCSTGEYVIRAFDSSIPDSINVSEYDTIQVGINGADAGFMETCSQIFGLVADFDGNIYQSVAIGNQVWITENLRSSSYSNGDPIPFNTSNWASITFGVWTQYEHSVQNEHIYGKLYSNYAVADVRNVCPIGWHVPSDSEWTELAEYLGGVNSAGGKMKSTGTQLWQNSNTGATNESGFSGLPGGAFFGAMGFTNIQNQGAWWSSNISSLHSLMGNTGEFVIELDNFWMTLGGPNGLYVRCLKD
jgi:uncharacterized protein (TIGR02145 family)